MTRAQPGSSQSKQRQLKQSEAAVRGKSAAWIAVKHQLRTDALPYMAMLHNDGQEDAAQTSADYVEAYLREMAPRNPVERMLAMQMLWQHVRIGRMAKVASDPGNNDAEIYSYLNGVLDTAMNTYRRQALTYQQLREPVQPIKATQLNVARQQVVAQQNRGKRLRSRAQAKEKPSEAAKELPAVGEGSDFFDQLRQQDAAVGAVNRAADRRG